MQSFMRHALGLAFAVVAVPAFAATVNEPLTVSGTMVGACALTGTPLITFASLPPLSTSADATANTGASLQLACSNGLAPELYVTGTHAMANAGATVSIPINLSLTAGAAADDIPIVTGTALANFTDDGAAHAVLIYALVTAANSSGVAVGTYNSTNLIVNVDY